MKLSLVLIIALAAHMGWAQTVSVQTKPLQQVQILALLLNDVSSPRVGDIVAERGITFDPSKEYITLLKKAGGGEEVVLALATTHRTGERAVSQKAPLGKDTILELLTRGAGSAVIKTEVTARGVNFEPTDDLLDVYRFAGADESLLATLAKRQSGRAKGSPSASPATARRLRLDSEVASGKLLFRPNPVYPPLATKARAQGTVRLEGVIGKDGTIQQLTVLSGHPLLVKAALEAVQQWRYQPWLINGEPVEVVTTVDVNFSLRP